LPYRKKRTIEEKIQECLDEKIQNLHPNLREKLFVELQSIPEANNVVKCKKYVSELLSLPEMGKHTKKYWSSRGWSEGESYIKSKQNALLLREKTNTLSPYSQKFWTSKINPNTGKYYTEDEADYERNSRRPIRKEYWIKKGYSEEDSEKLALEVKNKNNKKGSNKSKNNKEIQKITSKRCIEYWIALGYNKLEAKEQVSKEQATFTLEKCIKKYGEQEGQKVWNERQEKWKDTLDKKSENEKNEIKRKKATKINYRSLWNKELDENGVLYLIKVYGLGEEFYKIGITTRSLYARYGGNKIGNYNYEIVDVFEDTVHRSFLLEQKIIKENKNISYIPKQKFEGWTECFYEKPIINS
jgi:hypothetical protein